MSIHVVLGRGVRGRRTKFCTVTMIRLRRETTVRKPFQHLPCRSFAAPLQERLGLQKPLLDSGHTDTKLSYQPWRPKSSFAETIETHDTKSSNSIICVDGYQGHEVVAKVYNSHRGYRVDTKRGESHLYILDALVLLYAVCLVDN